LHQKGRQIKTLNLFKITAISCALLFVSGTAMAVEDCASGYLTGFITTDILIPEGETCVIENVIVQGNIEAVGAVNVTVYLARVSGRVFIQDSAIVSVQGGQAKYINLSGNEIAIVLGNIAHKNLLANNNTRVWIEKNEAGEDLICRGNENGSAVGNRAGGEKDCRVFENAD
jgi:hypothetical protein